MIRIDAVTKQRGSVFVAVDDVSLEIGAGLTAVIGPNGAGKSTLLAAVGRLVGTDAGTVVVGGLDIATTRSRGIARQLAILQQDNHLAVRLSVEDLVAFGRFPHGGSGRSPQDRAPSRTRWTCSTCRRCGAVSSTSCPAVSASARSSRWPWRRTPSTCCWTSR